MDDASLEGIEARPSACGVVGVAWAHSEDLLDLVPLLEFLGVGDGDSAYGIDALKTL